MTAKIRAAREALGWSQTALAERAGVSRQLVSAIESGRHQPNVAAAIGIARALNMLVEELFAEPFTRAVPVLGEDQVMPDRPDTREVAVTVAAVGETVVAVPARHGVINPERWAWADATMAADGALTMLSGGSRGALVIAGCDPALGVLAEMTERHTGHRVLTAHASTGKSLDALAAGRVHGVVVHAPAGQMPVAPVPVRRWHLARWQVGVTSGRAAGVPTVEEIAERNLHVVQRDLGASTQSAFTRALQRIGAPMEVRGPIAEGHVDVARRVAAGAGAGLTMEAAARSFGLGFVPLEDHEVQVWIDARWANLPAVIAVLTIVGSAALKARLGLIGGYDLAMAATEVA
jgi:DNA-binding XRE family transcriptional regulator/molybdate-binding protein